MKPPYEPADGSGATRRPVKAQREPVGEAGPTGNLVNTYDPHIEEAGAR
ncbi:hypothetical protein [Streptomyces liliifuscus]|uniref:Uncharacterized protein n=1 Tax=Streptomyces liliifuscus TaxID=2797636 RepID=A0A7T7L1V1_9ACTN|nr:hypothetical protein [Streptomyces liliifuscus]QQM44889.1 hypothetical protein JEQ17_39450 [Streptomyces liliifuscus]